MKLRRIHLLVALLGALACLLPFRSELRAVASGVAQQTNGKKTVADRLAEHGAAARARMAADFRRVGLLYPPERVRLVGLKQEGILEVWVADAAGAYRHLKAFPILAASGGPGPKRREGDRQVPEGLYQIESLNPNSRYHLSLRLNYPNAFDRQKGREDGRKDLGSDIMIHGKAVSVGCLAMGDPAIEELFVLVADTGRENVSVILSPVDFRKRELPAELPELPSWTPELHRLIRDELRKLNQAPAAEGF